MKDKMAGFEAAMEELNEILREMADENTTLQQSVGLYAKAAGLIENCQAALGEAELQVKEIDEKMQVLLQGEPDDL